MNDASSLPPRLPDNPRDQATLAHLLEGVCPLPGLGVIQAEGEDAAAFLHNQLTQDVVLLPVGQARLAAFCNAKGRMQASFVVLKTAPGTVLLVLSADLLERTLKRLSMFVLRAKVKLTDASAHWRVYGLLGSSASARCGEAPPWQALSEGSAHAIALYPAVLASERTPRALWIGPESVAAPAGPALETDLWRWAEVLGGVPIISAPLFELFVPQMLNYESVGGVNFKKGCYPGQEVVARSQYRGTLKRRMRRAFSSLPLTPAQELFTADEPEQPCATVVAAAPRPDGTGWDALVCGTHDMAKINNLELFDVPYVILDDIN